MKDKLSFLAVIVCGLLAGITGQAAFGQAAPSPASAGGPQAKELRVAAVQMRSSEDIEDNVAKTIRYIQQSANDGARVVVFPELSVTGYFDDIDIIKQVSVEQLAALERRIADACKEAHVYAIVGMPFRQEEKIFNSAIVISPEGKVIERYHKMDGWDRGDHMSIYQVDGVWCTTIICHDERYPELVRLPVLAGAQVVFYISHESGLGASWKLDPYRAQIQERAAENSVFVVHANAPANLDGTGSHGQSRIVSPHGTVFQEASMFEEEVVTATLDVSAATRSNAVHASHFEALRSWWREGANAVRRIK